MKNLILTFALLLSISFGFSQSNGTSITVSIDNVQNDNGVVSFALHTKETFMKGAGVASAQSKVKDGKVIVTFKNVQPGEYAIIALHDENENNQMDYQANGMPKEAYGSSNNPMTFGPPQFGESKFTVADKNLDLQIRF